MNKVGSMSVGPSTEAFPSETISSKAWVPARPAAATRQWGLCGYGMLSGMWVKNTPWLLGPCKDAQFGESATMVSTTTEWWKCRKALGKASLLHVFQMTAQATPCRLRWVTHTEHSLNFLTLRIMNNKTIFILRPWVFRISTEKEAEAYKLFSNFPPIWNQIVLDDMSSGEIVHGFGGLLVCLFCINKVLEILWEVSVTYAAGIISSNTILLVIVSAQGHHAALSIRVPKRLSAA